METEARSAKEAELMAFFETESARLRMNVIVMLIGFIAMIAIVDFLLLKTGHLFNPSFDLSLNWIFGKIFYPFAWSMGIPTKDIANAATLLGQKLTINEFVAFKSLTSGAVPIISQKGLLIVSIAICGFANFSSVGMQIGGIGAIVPGRRADLAKLAERGPSETASRQIDFEIFDDDTMQPEALLYDADGHMAAVFIAFERKPSKDQILSAWKEFGGKPQQLAHCIRRKPVKETTMPANLICDIYLLHTHRCHVGSECPKAISRPNAYSRSERRVRRFRRCGGHVHIHL